MTTHNAPPTTSPAAILPRTGIGDWSSVTMMGQPNHDLVCIGRPVAFETEAIVRAADIGTTRSQVDPSNALEIASGLYVSLGITDDRLAMDAAALVEAFENAMPNRPTQLRIDVCDTTTCPKFHHDHRHTRLVTTYCGPTTQYMLADWGDQVFDAAPWELLLFKGANHPTFSQCVVHRSPPTTCGQRRLCLVIDC